MTWITARATQTVRFTGQLLIVSNVNLSARQEMEAVGSRVRLSHFDLSGAESIATAKSTRRHGYHHRETGSQMTGTECWEVFEFVIEELEHLRTPVDLRLLPKCFDSYIFHRVAHAKEKYKAFKERTGKSRSAYYRSLKRPA